MNKLFLFLPLLAFSEPSHEDVFSSIYQNKVWGVNEEGEGFSGGGSLVENAQPYMDFLVKFMKEHEIQSVVDVGCGDWEFSRHIDWSGIDYFGYDVVPFVIEKNIKRYGAPNIHFAFANMVSQDLPKADLLLCKHVLQHLSNKDISAFISQFSKYKYCLITNEVYPHILAGDNRDIATGGCHKVDLSSSPFYLQGKKVFHFKIGGSMHQVFLYESIKRVQ